MSGRESCEQSQHSKAVSALTPLLRRSLCTEENPLCWTISYSSHQASSFCIETGLLLREISQSEWCYRVAQNMHFQTFHSTWKLGVGLSIKHSRFYSKLPFAVESVFFWDALSLVFCFGRELKHGLWLATFIIIIDRAHEQRLMLVYLWYFPFACFAAPCFLPSVCKDNNNKTFCLRFISNLGISSWQRSVADILYIYFFLLL